MKARNMQIIIPEALLTRDEATDPTTRWPARIPTEGQRITDVIDQLNARLCALDPDEPMHYYSFSVMHTSVQHAPRWPYGAWIGCFPVRGSNEGFYVHIHAILRDGTNQLLAVCKTEFEEISMRLANTAFLLLEA